MKERGWNRRVKLSYNGMNTRSLEIVSEITM